MKVVFFSVVIPLYNKESSVARAIQSVLNQTIQDFEIVVVNDGSADNGPDIVSKIKDPRIRLISQENQGVSAARNRGIAEAKYDLIAFLDADDEWLPDYLQTIINLYQKFPSCKAFGTQYYFCRSNGHRRLATVKGIPDNFKDGILTNYFEIASISDPPLWTSAVSVDKNAITAIGGFPVVISSGEDLLTWARLAVNFPIAYSTQPGAIHYHPQTIADRPDRVPPYPDIVSQSLRELLTFCTPEAARGLKAYIALWHKMRAIIFLQGANRNNALRELLIATKMAPNINLCFLLTIAWLPRKIFFKIFGIAKKTKNLLLSNEK